MMPVFAGVSYPIRDDVPAGPWAMVRQSELRPTVYEKRPGRHLVKPFIEVLILIPSHLETPREQAKLDPLPTQVLDLFDANTVGGNINHAFPDLPGPIDRVWNDATVQRQALEWGKGRRFCYAARITLDSQFERKPQETS